MARYRFEEVLETATGTSSLVCARGNDGLLAVGYTENTTDSNSRSAKILVSRDSGKTYAIASLPSPFGSSDTRLCTLTFNGSKFYISFFYDYQIFLIRTGDFVSFEQITIGNGGLLAGLGMYIHPNAKLIPVSGGVLSIANNGGSISSAVFLDNSSSAFALCSQPLPSFMGSASDISAVATVALDESHVFPIFDYGNGVFRLVSASPDGFSEMSVQPDDYGNSINYQATAIGSLLSAGLLIAPDCQQFTDLAGAWLAKFANQPSVNGYTNMPSGFGGALYAFDSYLVPAGEHGFYELSQDGIEVVSGLSDNGESGTPVLTDTSTDNVVILSSMSKCGVISIQAGTDWNGNLSPNGNPSGEVYSVPISSGKHLIVMCPASSGGNVGIILHAERLKDDFWQNEVGCSET